MKLIKDQRGIADLVLLIIGGLILVGGVGFVAWRAYQASHHKSNVVTYTPNTTSNNTTTPTHHTSTTKYLTIKEWGVRFPISGLLTDAIYRYRTFNTGNSTASAVDLAQKSIADKYPECGPTGSAPQYVIGRYKKGDQYYDKVVGVTTFPGIHIGNYYYAGHGPQAACAFDSNNNLVSPSNMADVTDWTKAVAKLQLVP